MADPDLGPDLAALDYAALAGSGLLAAWAAVGAVFFSDSSSHFPSCFPSLPSSKKGGAAK